MFSLSLFVIFFQKVFANFTIFAMHKYASNIVEKCIAYTSPSENAKLLRSMTTDMFITLSCNSYGNYVVQKLFLLQSLEVKAALSEIVDKLDISSIRDSPHGKHIATHIENNDEAMISMALGG